MLVFIDRSNNQEIVTKIVGILRAGSFKELFNSYPTDRFGLDEKQLFKQMSSFYTPEQEIDNGVVGLKLHRLSN